MPPLGAMLLPFIVYAVSLGLMLGTPRYAYAVVLVLALALIGYHAQTYGRIGPILGWSWKGRPGSTYNWFSAIPTGAIVPPALAAWGQVHRTKTWAREPLVTALLEFGGWLTMVGTLVMAATGQEIAGFEGWRFNP